MTEPYMWIDEIHDSSFEIAWATANLPYLHPPKLPPLKTKGVTMNPEWMSGVDPLTDKDAATPWSDWLDQPIENYSTWRTIARSNRGLTFLESPSGAVRVILSAANEVIWQGWDKVESQQAWDTLHGKGKADNHTLVVRLGNHIPDFYARVKCPGCEAKNSVYSLVQHLNDSHKWTRNRIADWLETLDLDLTVHQEEVKHEAPAPGTKKAYGGVIPSSQAASMIEKTMPHIPVEKATMTSQEVQQLMAGIQPAVQQMMDVFVDMTKSATAMLQALFADYPNGEIQNLLGTWIEDNEKKKEQDS